MPGQTTNDNLVATGNQAIVSLNELLLLLENDDLNPEYIASILHTMRTEITQLVTAVANLQLVCQTIVRVDINNFFQPYTPATEPGGEGIPAPSPFEELEYDGDTIQDRKCFMATTITDEFANWLQRWDDLLLDEMLNLSLISMLSLWIASIGAATTEGALMATVLTTTEGILAGIAKYMINNFGTIEFSDIKTTIDANRTELICDLYDAPNVTQARSDFVATLSAAGLSVVNQGFVAVALDYHYLNYLFYIEDDSIEQAFLLASGYDCSTCEGGFCDNRTQPWQIVVQQGPNFIVIDAVVNPNPVDAAYYASLFIDATEDLLLCGGTVTITGITIQSGSVQGYGINNFRVGDKKFPNQPGNLYSSSVPPTEDIPGARVAAVKSTTAFRVRIDWI